MTHGYPEKLDVVIPARNERATIGRIVRECLATTQVDNVIVVIDPSDMEATERAVRPSRRTHVLFSPNSGKGQCVAYGLKTVETDRVIFCDADYRGLSRLHVTELCRAYSGGQIIGVPDIPSNYPQERLWAWKWVSGFRSVPTEVVQGLDLHGYVMETQINKAMGLLGGRPTHWFRCRGLQSRYDMNPLRVAARNADLAWGRANGILP